jgi:glycosyltransferase involved in cell wall biosynthesis
LVRQTAKFAHGSTIVPQTVSVVIPTFNARSWVVETLESVLGQSYPQQNVEIIVVDDASTDDTAAVTRDYVRRRGVPTRHIQHPDNRGVSSARNTGWHQAQGDWIQFVDADDLLAPHKLAVQVASLEHASSQVDVVYSPWQELALVANTWRASGPVLTPFVDDSPVVRILQDLRFGYVGPCLIRKDVLRSTGGFDNNLRLGEDLDLTLRVAMTGGRFLCAPTEVPAFFYRLTPNSLSHQSTAELQQVRMLLGALRRVEGFLRAQRSDRTLDDAAADALWRYYERLSSFVWDVATLYEIAGWVAALERPYSPGLNRRMQLVARYIGWKNAVRARALYRRLPRKFAAASA